MPYLLFHSSNCTNVTNCLALTVIVVVIVWTTLVFGKDSIAKSHMSEEQRISVIYGLIAYIYTFSKILFQIISK